MAFWAVVSVRFWKHARWFLSGASFYLSLEALSIWTVKSELSVMVLVYTGVIDTTADKDAQGLLTLAVWESPEVFPEITK